MGRTTTGCTFMTIFFMSGCMIGCQSASEKHAVLSQVSQASQISVASNETKQQHKKAALANVELGLGYLSQGQMARAKTKLTHALKLAPKMTETHSAMAHFLEQVGQLKDAEHQHKKALYYGTRKTANAKGAVYNNYAAFLCRQKRWEEADQAFNEALSDKDYARTAEVYENAGICALKSPNPAKAKGYLMNAIQQDPKRRTQILPLIPTLLTSQTVNS